MVFLEGCIQANKLIDYLKRNNQNVCVQTRTHPDFTLHIGSFQILRTVSLKIRFVLISIHTLVFPKSVNQYSPISF